MKKMVLKAFTMSVSGRWRSSSSLEVSDPVSSSAMCPSRSGPVVARVDQGPPGQRGGG
jgi:hypothetical protein